MTKTKSKPTGGKGTKGSKPAKVKATKPAKEPESAVLVFAPDKITMRTKGKGKTVTETVIAEAVVAPDAEPSPCPAGGDHTFENDGVETSCTKCHEPESVPVAKVFGRKAKTPKEPKPAKVKKVSALDAAAQVLADSKTPMNCMALVEAMASAGLWESPGGKTPHATLYSAILREIGTKGDQSRFKKAEQGQFTATAQVAR